jgi:DNA-binding transcriptional MerR regulator
MANVTVKTLHHYHKIGLLLPCEVSDAGYRFYSMKELERLQEILFYRELDFPLRKIKQILTGEHDRLKILKEQKMLLQSPNGKNGATDRDDQCIDPLGRERRNHGSIRDVQRI